MPWPPAFAQLTRWVEGVISLDFSSLLPLECALEFTFHAKLVSTFVVMLAVNLMCFAGWCAARMRRTASRAAAGIQVRIAYVWIAFNYLAYISVCTTIFRTIAACESFDDGSTLLKVDYRIDCATTAHTWHKALAWIGVPLFVFGCPAMFFGLLCLDRSKTTKADEAVAENEVTFSPLVGFLAEPFLPNRYFVEPLICLQKVTVAGLLVFLAPSYAQMLYGIVFACFWCTIFALLAPFRSDVENIINTTINFSTILVLLGALSLKLDLSDEQGLERSLTNGLLWICSLLPVAALSVAAMSELLFGDAMAPINALGRSLSKRFSGTDQRPVEIELVVRIEDELASGEVSEC